MGPQLKEHIEPLTPERLHIRWKGFASNLLTSLETIQDATTDLWLVAAKQKFRAHRLILASASPVLRNLLLELSANGAEQDPVLILDDVDSQTLQDLLAYLYRGQVNLSPPRLEALLSVGKSIALKGIEDLQISSTPTLFTGLSLLASAALSTDTQDCSLKKPRLLSNTFNDENDPLNARCPPSDNAINLSTKKPNFFSPLLNIPDPSSFKWRKIAGESLPEREETPPLAIDMSTPPNSGDQPLMELPATPSPSPSSMTDSGLVQEDMETSSLRGSQCNSAEGKKWKSRQPKLCVHCDRYFSNQFNLKQVSGGTLIKTLICS